MDVLLVSIDSCSVLIVFEINVILFKIPALKRYYHWSHMNQPTPIITKTRPYNFDPLKPHFYIVKLGFTGVYIIFHISAHFFFGEAVLTSTHNLCFEQKYEKYLNFLSDNFLFLVVKFSIYLNRRVFVMNRSFESLLSASWSKGTESH